MLTFSSLSNTGMIILLASNTWLTLICLEVFDLNGRIQQQQQPGILFANLKRFTKKNIN